MNKIVILTATYNRSDKLAQLYASLRNQSDKSFDWWIIDDGSTDNTTKYVKQIKEEKEINITYIFQENGGKARALNKAFELCDYATIFVVVDSDDYLLPTAISTISNYLNKYVDNNEIGGFFFYYETPNGEILKPDGEIIKKDIIMNRYEYDKNYKLNDGCVCYFNKVVEEYKYPEFEGEKYVGPTVLQMEMAEKYKMVFSPEVIGVAEYQIHGLTRSGRKLRIQNPLGMIYYSGLHQSNQSTVSNKIKHSIGAQAYRFFSNKDIKFFKENNLKKSLKPWAFIPGLILKIYWQRKWSKEENGG